MYQNLPVNPAILQSTINTLLRDGEFENLGDICRYYDRPVAEENHIVQETELADKVGSGLLPVYATPSVVALMEHTACMLVESTVGTRMAIDHVKACPAGEEVKSTAMLVAENGRQYDFLIEVRDSRGALLAKAEHTRFQVDPERFMAKLH